ncbi:MAG: hypothetical protein FWH15_09570 [Betaproteobacteria bacterium]|nr:hypothetical protein [Betaproteobacteria bacterium]
MFHASEFKGSETYNVECTGDCVVNDEVQFERATFSGSFRRPKFNGFERITAKIVADSYGKDKQQHTFTLQLADGNTIRIKGRNLYANGVWRKAWPDENLRRIALDEKHKRGDAARAARTARKENYEYDR